MLNVVVLIDVTPLIFAANVLELFSSTANQNKLECLSLKTISFSQLFAGGAYPKSGSLAVAQKYKTTRQTL
jgi:hypothetical protein